MTNPNTVRIIELQAQVISLEHQRDSRRFWDKLFKLALLVLAMSILGTWALFSFEIPAAARELRGPFVVSIILSAVVTASYLIYFYGTETSRASVSEIELELSLALEERALQSAALAVDPHVRRAAYRDRTGKEVSSLRAESRHYRRISNYLQSVIIIGSLAATTLAGISTQTPVFRWATLIATFAVGLAAGFSGFFKFRERGFYLQITADALELEWVAVDLGIGRYAGLNVEQALSIFVEEAERLKSEQRKREQSLEQNPEQRDATGAQSSA